MPGLFSDSYEPSWLQQKKSPADFLLEGSQVGAQIGSNIIRARQAEMQALESTAQVGEIMAKTELSKQKIDQVNRDNASWLQEAPAVSKWLLLPDDKLDTAPTPDVESQKSVQLIEKRRQAKDLNDYRRSITDVKQQQADNMLEAAKLKTENQAVAVKDRNEWQNGYNQLSPENRNVIEQSGGLDKDGFVIPTFRGQVNDLLTQEGKPPVGRVQKAQSAIGKLESDKALAVKSGAPQEVIDAYDAAIHKVSTRPSTEKPEFFTDPTTNRRFMRWGSKHYDLSGVTPQQRTLIETAKADYNRASAALDKNTDATKKDELLQNIFTARDALNALTKGAPATEAPQEKTGKGDNDPLNLFK